MSTVTPSSPVQAPITKGVPVEALLDVVGDSLEDKAVNSPAVSASTTGSTTGTTTGATAAAWDPLSVLTAGTAEPAARFRYDVRSGDWWWSPGMFELHGLTDGEVAPSTDLLMSHKHPDDLAATEQTLRRVLATGEPFCCRHRVIDAGGEVREVLSVGEAVCAADGSIATVQGYFIDLTGAFEAAVEQAATSVLEVEPRRPVVDPTIEQAKGVLVAAFRLTPAAALELLTWRSEETGADLSVVSRGLVTAFSSPHEDDLSAARRACACLGLAALDED
ncbi:PAS and ANTAR domain-containing protein [Pedococcus sp. KACC 23699]|uniref:PAS and ANTAR domain-containing protein n=1 Tax=Pedococcus sp. KACC 23699 TaxID=3149228 RepID=A0AAU7JQB3_9MICO